MSASYPTLWLGQSWEKGIGYSSAVYICLPPEEDGDEVVCKLEEFSVSASEAINQPEKFAAFVERWTKYADENHYSFEFNDDIYEKEGSGKFRFIPLKEGA